MSVYVIAAMDIHDREQYEKYSARNVGLLLSGGCEILAVDDAPVVLEGESPASRMVILKFAHADDVSKWHQSPEYAAIRPIRQASTDTKFCITCQSLGN